MRFTRRELKDVVVFTPAFVPSHRSIKSHCARRTARFERDKRAAHFASAHHSGAIAADGAVDKDISRTLARALASLGNIANARCRAIDRQRVRHRS